MNKVPKDFTLDLRPPCEMEPLRECLLRIQAIAIIAFLPAVILYLARELFPISRLYCSKQ